MLVKVRNTCRDFKSYRAARVRSLFNVDTGAEFSLDANLAIDDDAWRIGVVVGPSGSGKTSIGRAIWGPEAFYAPEWPENAPIVDAVAPGGDFDAITGAFAAVGLGSVPTWLRPYPVLSNGEKFRADMARLVVEAPARAVIDEFTSVVDRQIARIGALAFAKVWRRGKGQVVLLTPHYDILDWLEPDWIFDTAGGSFERAPAGRVLRRRPRFDLEIIRTNWRYWPEFEPHHYLKLPKMPASTCYVGLVGGERVCHIGVSTIYVGTGLEARACRLVVKPEWQGAGVGVRFLNRVCALQRGGGPGAHSRGRKLTTLFHTSHPGLVAALRRDPNWRQVSGGTHGGNKQKSIASLKRSGGVGRASTGYGGHFRAVQGFRYVGPAWPEAPETEAAAPKVPPTHQLPAARAGWGTAPLARKTA